MSDSDIRRSVPLHLSVDNSWRLLTANAVDERRRRHGPSPTHHPAQIWSKPCQEPVKANNLIIFCSAACSW